VDDEITLVEIGKGMLEKLGYRVEIRTSPREALEAFRANSEKFDLLITDMTMPEMTGDQLAHEFRTLRPTLPIIIATGFSKALTPEKTALMGINGIIMKPFTLQEMATAVRDALDDRGGVA
jgi:DNA-binding NtrC family response regulator